VARTKGSKNAAGNKDGYNAYVKELEDRLLMYESRDADENADNISVNPNDYIKVMSLLAWRLNLCTREKGQGKVYKFDTLYQVKKIIYSDLVDIMEANADFLKAGYFIILNPKVVRIHGLDETYQNILTKEKIEEILNASNESVSLYSSTNEKQQKVIIDLLINRLVEKPDSVDLNAIDKLSRVSGVNIVQKAEEGKALSAPVVEEKK
jgi:hypothetical protein